MRFSLKQLLILIGLISGVLSIGPCAYRMVNGNLDEISRFLHDDRRICEVEVRPNEQVEGLIYDTYRIRFSIAGKPKSKVSINTPDVALFTNSRHIHLDRIGDIALVTSYIQSGSYPMYGGVDIGAESMLAQVLPCTIRNFDDLISRYDELLIGFEKWPTSSERGIITLSPTERIEYWAEPIKSK